MSKVSTGFAFVAGLTIGAAGAWYYLKDKYAKLAEEEIASVKAAYAKREKPTTEEKTVSVVNAAKHMDKGSITEYTQRLQEAGYKDYSRTIDEKPSGTPGEVPYVISPDEFGELEDYTKVSLTYFADGISKYGDFEWFVSEDPYVSDTPPWFGPGEPHEEDSTPFDVR